MTEEEEEEVVKDAIKFFGIALQLDEDFICSMFHLGLMYRKTGEYSDALKLFTRVIIKLPNDKSVYLERGLVYQEMGNHNYAINDFKKAIEIDPTSSLAYFHIGTSKLKTRSLVREAIEDFTKSESLDQSENAGIDDGLG